MSPYKYYTICTYLKLAGRPWNFPWNVYMGMPFDRPIFFSKLLERDSAMERAMEGFSATIITVQGLFTCSVRVPFA